MMHHAFVAHPEPWNHEHIGWHIARRTREVRGATPLSPLEVCDALERVAARAVQREVRAAAGLAVVLLVLDAVEAIRAAHGAWTPSPRAPGATATSIATGVLREVRAEVTRRATISWAQALWVQVCVREASMAAGAPVASLASMRPPADCEPADFVAMLEDAEVAAVVDLRRAGRDALAAAGPLGVLAAIASTRRDLAIDRTTVVERAERACG